LKLREGEGSCTLFKLECLYTVLPPLTSNALPPPPTFKFIAPPLPTTTNYVLLKYDLEYALLVPLEPFVRVLQHFCFSLPPLLPPPILLSTICTPRLLYGSCLGAMMQRMQIDMYELNYLTPATIPLTAFSLTNHPC